MKSSARSSEHGWSARHRLAQPPSTLPGFSFAVSGLLRDRLALVVRVQDNGTGMSEVQRRRIFEPFYTSKPTGTGLGTSIALRLVEAHGGDNPCWA
ncbi:ATP-binding protein [Anatilimnocola aggregata]|uniref:ATP-binding protein n=1 Tax=Anatilimnocola aggregata TaxID=2528021 RepID=UPI0021BC4456|nr:ATP-binding protein [Anatilimnocola aggregata]